MASGLGQLHGLESSPDFPQGMDDYDSLYGADQVGQSSNQSSGETGVVHMGGSGQGQGGQAQPNVMSHWSNLLNFKQGALPWLAVATILYLGLVSLHVSAGIGRRR